MKRVATAVRHSPPSSPVSEPSSPLRMTRKERAPPQAYAASSAAHTVLPSLPSTRVTSSAYDSMQAGGPPGGSGRKWSS